MNLEYFISEIDRAYRCLSAEEAEMQNHLDITAWLQDRHIIRADYDTLMAYNKKRYQESRLKNGS